MLIYLRNGVRESTYNIKIWDKLQFTQFPFWILIYTYLSFELA